MEDYVLTTDDALKRGLELVGFSAARQSSVRRSKNMSRFRTWYGSNPVVCSSLWQKLHQTTIERAQINWKNLSYGRRVRYYFMAIHMLACYPTEQEAEGTWGKSDKTWRCWVWHIVGCIAAIKPEIIRWPSFWGNSDSEDETIFIITVDGTHCPIQEPTHPAFSENTKFYSHKFHSAALDYEIAISIFTQQVVWVHGPFPAGDNDISIFRNKLKEKMIWARDNLTTNTVCRGIGDKGYRGERGLLSTPSSHDSQVLRDFKVRALSRHETFNKRLKNFDCLDERFRHSIAKHKQCFEAVAIICQLQMDCGNKLFLV